MIIIKPAIIKTPTLCSDSQISCGTLATNPASTAPAPSVTNSAGKAQQINVPKEVNKLTVLSNVFLCILFLMMNVRYVVASIRNCFSDSFVI